MAEICEKEGFIERYYVDQPKDRVDETLRDLQQYTRTLVLEEQNLGNLIESAVKQMAAEERKEEDEDIEEEDELSLEDLDKIRDTTITDNDFEEFSEFEEDEEDKDVELYNNLIKGDE